MGGHGHPKTVWVRKTEVACGKEFFFARSCATVCAPKKRRVRSLFPRPSPILLLFLLEQHTNTACWACTQQKGEGRSVPLFDAQKTKERRGGGKTQLLFSPIIHSLIPLFFYLLFLSLSHFLPHFISKLRTVKLHGDKATFLPPFLQ